MTWRFAWELWCWFWGGIGAGYLGTKGLLWIVLRVASADTRRGTP